MKQKLIASLLTLCLMISIFPVTASAVIMDSGTLGGISWTFDPSSGELVLSGSGTMERPTQGYPWEIYYGDVVTLIISEGMTHIGDRAFPNFTRITELKLPESLVSIGEHAFRGCLELRSVTIPENVRYIGGYAFDECTRLTSATVLGSGSTLISTFCRCTSLTEVSLPEGVEVLQETFSQCENLVDISLPDSLRIIKSAFAACWSLSTVTLPDGLLEIGDRSFTNAYKLDYLVIPASVQTIGSHVFQGTPSNTQIYFTGDAPQFADDAFGGTLNPSQVKIFYPENNTTWTADVRQSYGGNVTWTAYDPADAPGAPEISEPELPEEPVTGVCGENAVWSLNRRTGVITISGTGPMDDHYRMGQPWSDYREEIQKVVIEEGITYVSAVGFNNLPNLTAVTFPSTLAEIGEKAFLGNAISELTLPYGLTIIGEGAFSGCPIQELILPDTVTTIHTEAFRYCEKLERVVLPSALKYMDSGAFSHCYYLSEIIAPAMPALEWIGARCFYACGRLEDISWYPSTQMMEDAFSGTGVHELIIPECVTWIGQRTFSSCESLVSVYIHEDVSFIDTGAFSECYALKQVVFEGNAPTVSADPFYNSRNVVLYYPRGNSTWTSEVRSQIGGTAEWIAYTPGSPLPAYNPFTDVKSSDYFYEPVLWAVENNITGGISANKFGPNQSCTRGQIVTFLWAAEGRPEPVTTENPFSDVRTSDYYYKAVLWAVENGITSGVGPGRFGPNLTCTRGQVATFLWAAQGKPAPESMYNPFSDVKSSDYYFNAVLWAVENGITGGIGNGRFGPSNICTRGQIVTFLFKAKN